MAKNTYPKGLDHRQRDEAGEIRRKRSDTQIKTLRAEYGEHFLPGYRATTELRTVLRKEGVDSLHALLPRKRKRA